MDNIDPLKGKIDRLFTLTAAQFRVIYLKYKGLSNTEIERELGREPGTVTGHITNSYKILGLANFPDEEKASELANQYEDVFKALDLERVDWKEFNQATWNNIKADYLKRYPLRDPKHGAPIDVTDSWPVSTPEIEQETSAQEDQEEEDIFNLGREVQVHEEPPQPRPQVWRRIIAFAVIILIVGFILFRIIDQPVPDTPPQLQEEETIIDTPVAENTDFPSTEVTDTPEPPLAEDPPQIPAEEATPQSPGVVIDIDEATPIPLPTPTEGIALGETLFEDYFDGNYSPHWKHYHGEPIYYHNAIGVQADELLLTIGDESWDNYLITVTLDTTTPTVALTLYIRLRDFLNTLTFSYVNDEIVWFVFDNYSWLEMDGTRMKVGRIEKLYVWVIDDYAYAGTKLGEPISSFRIPDEYASKYTSGGLGFQIKLDTKVYDIRVLQIK